MLSDDAIQKLIEPIVKNQEAINMMVIKDIAKKIQEIGKIPKSDLHKLERILKMGGDAKKMTKEISKLTRVNAGKIRTLLKLIAGDAYLAAKPFYDYRELPFIPFEKNKELQTRLQALERITLQTYLNLSNSQMIGFYIRDLKNPGKMIFLPLEEAYKSVIDEAVQAAQSGVVSYSTAMRRTLKQLTESGLRTISDDSVKKEIEKAKKEETEEEKPEEKPSEEPQKEAPEEEKKPEEQKKPEEETEVEKPEEEPKKMRPKKPPKGVRVVWKSGYTKRLDSTVKQNVLDGIREVNQETQNIVGEQFGADGKEITVHSNPAPDHAPFQGHQFTNEEWNNMQGNEPFEDIKGQKFPALKRIIGQWNCRHFAYSIIIGVSKPIYLDEQLDEIEEQNQKGYDLPNGKHLTMYECTQYMRKLERQIRYAKEEQMAAMEAGDIELAKTIYGHINQLVAEYLEFCQACGLKPMTQNLYVPGYKDLPKKYR